MKFWWQLVPLVVALAVFGQVPRADGMARGADVGWLSEMEAAKRVFKDRTGKPGDLFAILKEQGVNSIRLRVWVDPVAGWCGKADVVKQALRAYQQGFRIMIDFHYSDTWADPGNQTKPKSWSQHSLEQLKTDVSLHTLEVLNALKEAGVVPTWVQVGNETNDGMLWDQGKASLAMANFAGLVQSGARAVKSVFPQAKVVVHLSNGFDNSLFRWMFDGLKKNAVEWDVVGMSLYPEPATWRATEAQCVVNLKDMVARYGKQVVVSEVGMDWAAPDSSYALLAKLQADVAALPNGAGLGVFYWEPASFAGWNGYQKGAFDNSGRPTRALEAFREAATTAVRPGRAVRSTLAVCDLLGRPGATQGAKSLSRLRSRGGRLGIGTDHTLP